MLPSSDLTKSQIDRLGDRLRKRDISDDGLRLLDTYRRSFTEAYEHVVTLIRDRLELEPTGRPAKSTTSIVEKLRRESIRLSQIQDIAGCRLIVNDIAAQDAVVTQLKGIIDKSVTVDRREHPSHGYRAVHVIVDSGRKLIEIQVRTSLQHLWAEVSEKLSDVVDSRIKYGEGDEVVLTLLGGMSDNIKSLETAESSLLQALSNVDRELPQEINKGIALALELIDLRKKRAAELLDQIGEVRPRQKGQMDGLSN
jgi:putative GTP pyrophosphokinase